jgi:hypothetical protein
MSIADDLAAEVRSQCLAAEHFKNLWMATNDELEAVKQKNALLVQELRKAKQDDGDDDMYKAMYPGIFKD